MHEDVIIRYKKWRTVFLFCFGLFAGTAFAMKIIEKDLVKDGSVFSVIGLEIFYTKGKVISLLVGLDDHVKYLLKHHLTVDFAFMTGVYPGIAALCMMAFYKTGNKTLKKILLFLAILQVAAFICDVVENCFLLKWIERPSEIKHFALYHFLVSLKWILALAGAAMAIPLVIKKRQTHSH